MVVEVCAVGFLAELAGLPGIRYGVGYLNPPQNCNSAAATTNW